MASSVIGALRVVLGLDSAQFETGIKRSVRSGKSLEQMASSAATAVRGMAAALGIVSVGAAASGFPSLADQSKQMAAQLKLSTAQLGSFAKAQEDVRRIAADTRSSLMATTTLYGSFNRSAQELGRSQAEAAVATEVFSKALKVGGAGTAQVESATLQLGQALASANVQWEELGQILEASPRLAKIFTDSLGVTRGELKKMAEDGKLTSEMLFSALNDRKVTAGLDREFREMPVTFDEVMGQINSAAIITFGAFDQGGQFSTALANFIIGGTEGFADLEDAARSSGTATRAELEGLSAAFAPVIADLAELVGLFGEGEKASGRMFSQLFGELDAISAWWARNQWLQRLASGNFMSLPAPQSQTNLQKPYLDAADRADRRLRSQNAYDAISPWFQKTDVLGRPLEGAAPARPAAAGGGAGGKKGPSAETLRKRAEAEAKRAADNMRRFADDLARDQSRLNQSQAELSRSIEARAAAEVNAIETQRIIDERQIQSNDDLDEAKRAQLILLNNQNAEAEKAVVRQRLADDVTQRITQIEQDRADLAIELLGHSRELARTAQEAREIELRIVDLAFEAERARLEQIKATNAVTSAEYAYADARLKALPQLQAGAQFAARRQTQGPLESYLDRLPRSAAEAREAIERVQVDGVQGLVDGLADAATGAQNLGAVFKNVAKQIIADLIRIQIQRALVGAIGNALGLGGVAGGFSDKTAALAQPKKLPGFATGGSFRVGGPGGIDKNLIAFRATRGEMVDIRKPGQDRGGGSPVSFDLRGAVMTADLVAQMQQIATATGGTAAMAGGALGESRVMGRARQRIPG